MQIFTLDGQVIRAEGQAHIAYVERLFHLRDVWNYCTQEKMAILCSCKTGNFIAKSEIRRSRGLFSL